VLQITNNNSQKCSYKTVHESRVEELVLRGIKDTFDEKENEDNLNVETESNINIGFNTDNDVFTTQSEEPFFHCHQGTIML